MGYKALLTGLWAGHGNPLDYAGVGADYGVQTAQAHVRIGDRGVRSVFKNLIRCFTRDYEEGTWTPMLTFGGASMGMTYDTQAGRYVKIGKQVTLWFWIKLSAKGSSTGAAQLRGFPFTISGDAAAIGGGGALASWGSLNTPQFFVGLYLASGDTIASFVGLPAGAPTMTFLPDTAFTNNTVLSGHVTYYV